MINIEYHSFALFSKSILVIPTKPGRDIAWAKSTFSRNMTSNGLDLGKWRLFYMLKNCIFCTFSGKIIRKMAW